MTFPLPAEKFDKLKTDLTQQPSHVTITPTSDTTGTMDASGISLKYAWSSDVLSLEITDKPWWISKNEVFSQLGDKLKPYLM